MYYLSMFDEWVSNADLSALFYATSVTLIILIIFQQQVEEKLHRATLRVPWWLGWTRRVANTVGALSLAWGVLYSYDLDIAPWPPVVAIVLAGNVTIAIRLIITEIDYYKACYSDAVIADAHPSPAPRNPPRWRA